MYLVKKVLATPVARALARDLGIDINTVKGTGPADRVMKADIHKYKTSIHEPEQKVSVSKNDLIEYEVLSQIRKTIAQNMVVSKQTAPHMTIIDEVEITKLIEVRNKYKEQFQADGTSLSFLAFFMKATAQALKKTLCSQFGIRQS